MVTADENRPIAGSGERSGNNEPPAKKAEKRARKPSAKAGQKTGQKTSQKASQKPDRKSEPMPEIQLEAPEELKVAIESSAAAPSVAEVQVAETPLAATPLAAAPLVEIPLAEIPLAEIPVAATPAPEAPAPEPATAAAAPVSVHTITDAYGGLAQKSLEQTQSYFAQLASARSLNKAFEVQTEFAQQALQTFVAESLRIRELHRELAKQRLRSFEGFVMGRKR